MESLVSIIVPTYNRSNIIEWAITILLNQSHQNIEIIVVDDASTDDTGRRVQKVSDKRIVYHRLNKNGGASNARNIVIDLAQGDFITFLDSDDEYLPHKIERQVAELNARSL